MWKWMCTYSLLKLNHVLTLGMVASHHVNSQNIIDKKIDRFIWFYANTQDELAKQLSHKVEFRKNWFSRNQSKK